MELVSVGVDTWGVDWALFDKAGELVGLPHAYRDPRNAAAYEEVVAKLGADRIYQTTGIQFMPLNSLYSLYAHKQADPEAFAAADRLLFIPDLFHYWLSGERTIEATIASTSQMIDCHTGDWARDMLAELGLPTNILGPTITPGTIIGTLRPKLAEETGLPSELASRRPRHPRYGQRRRRRPRRVRFSGWAPANWCYLSSGTWSLLGAELDEPCVSRRGPSRIVHQRAGRRRHVSLLEKHRRAVARARMPARFRAPRPTNSTMPRSPNSRANRRRFARWSIRPRIVPIARRHAAENARFARATNQPVPDSPGEFVRCCLESLRSGVSRKAGDASGIDSWHAFRCDSHRRRRRQKRLLSQMTADATGRRVVVGPYEATAMGNVLVQAMAARPSSRSGPLAAHRVANSFELMTYEPHAAPIWRVAAERVAKLGVRLSRRVNLSVDSRKDVTGCVLRPRVDPSSASA